MQEEQQQSDKLTSSVHTNTGPVRKTRGVCVGGGDLLTHRRNKREPEHWCESQRRPKYRVEWAEREVVDSQCSVTCCFS